MTDLRQGVTPAQQDILDKTDAIKAARADWIDAEFTTSGKEPE